MFDNTKPNVILFADFTGVMYKTLGPYKVAYILREAGYEVAVINHVSSFSVGEIKHLLSNMITDKTLFVGVNNFFYSSVGGVEADSGLSVTEQDPGAILPHGRQYNAEIKQTIKSANANCKLVLGGPSAGDFDYTKDFDYVVLGYAEKSVLNLADHLLTGTELTNCHRSLYGPRIINDAKAQGYNFEQCRMRYEDHDVILPGETLSIEIGRGCIFRCAFCAYPLNGKKKFDYIRHRDLIVEEMIDNYQRFGVTRYQIVDDTFNDSVEKCQLMADIYQQLPFKLEWSAYIRLDLMAAHPETMDLLFDSGLKAAFFGIETMNPRTGALIGKGGSREKLIEALRYIRRKWGNSVNLLGSFIYGLPYETPESLDATTEFLMSDDNPLNAWQLRPLMIRPNIVGTNGFVSDIEANYEKYGYRNAGTVSTSQQFSSLSVNNRQQNLMHWKNKHFDYEELREFCTRTVHEASSQGRQCLGPFSLFQMLSLGIPMDSVLNQPFNKINWRLIDAVKLRRAIDYKKQLYRQLNIVPETELDQVVPTFRTHSNYLAHLHR
jgi:hypothetical protein